MRHLACQQAEALGMLPRSQVILAVPLARYLEEFRMKPGRMDLPFGCSTIRRLRERRGHHIRQDIRRWWE
jgi:hypothetical protein